MDKHSLWKWLVLIALTAWSLALVLPPSAKKIKLGLDLQGGTSFTIQIQQEEIEKQLRDEYKELTDEQIKSRIPSAVKRAQEQALEIIRNRVDALGVAEPLIYPEKDNRVVVQIPGLEDKDRNRAIDLIKSAAFLEFAMVHEENDKLVKALFDKGLAPEGYRAVSLDGRDNRGEYYQRDTKAGTMDAAFWARLERFQAPPGYRFMLEEKQMDGQKLCIPYFVKQRYEMKGDSLKKAGVEYDQLGRPYVTLSFDKKGERKFSRITSDYAPGGARNPSPEGRRYMAIIMDGRLYSAPFLKTAIYGGEAIIEGSFTLPEAQGLSIVLRSGSLPAPVEIIESRNVDPSLGRDSIESGTRATIYSCIIVVIFMVGYYFLGGLVANIGLLFNILLLPLAMMITSGIMGLITGGAGGTSASVGLPVLTLPGIAGIALTIGMAVDANVLIFERIREEQNLGKRLGAAIEGGYHKAFITILDSNLTTVMAAVILFIFGTGAVRGFGITLTAGIMVSMYTSLMVTRMIFNLIVTHTSLSSLKMMNLIKPTKIDFIGARKIALLVSLVVIVGAWSIVTYNGLKDPARVLGTDFTGGASLTFHFAQKQEVDKIRDALGSVGINQAHIQYQKVMDRPVEYLQVRVPYGAADKTKQVLLSTFSQAGFSVLNEDEIGPQVGKEMTRKALWAITLSLVGMIIYISARFRFAYAVGAVAALLHDVLVSAGLYCFFGRQIDMIIVAGLMTIIGFSVNDTIVIFDRIREKLKALPNMPFAQVCNLGINETLGRTILTSTTVFLAVIMLLIFGGGAINDFAFIFFIGIITGTYSTVFIATPVMMALSPKSKEVTGGVSKR
ncbi:MAG: protein translocase subunit SecD [Verrucomicrobia bacterium]|nr:protein translocase subunit SecD [Verrucomicrobiota bacterium]MBU4289598.1 protein translocase subunit SecD [Verrucomicrobiota bacterium]MBU4428266.1 protein translocase subunit SecD [Verrucomicrobiota bacterium]MCG2678740.1 protein translocase subunit SecD [Kiritimatiellia bacterium]